MKAGQRVSWGAYRDEQGFIDKVREHEIYSAHVEWDDGTEGWYAPSDLIVHPSIEMSALYNEGYNEAIDDAIAFIEKNWPATGKAYDTIWNLKNMRRP